VRLATWNVGYWGHAKRHEEAWRWLLDELRPDVALLQECVPPSWVQEEHGLIFGVASQTSGQPWGTAIVTVGHPLELRPLPELEAWVAALGPEAAMKCSATNLAGRCPSGQATLPGLGPVTVVSVHNPHFEIDAELLRDVDVSAFKLKLAKGIWLQDPLFEQAKGHTKRGALTVQPRSQQGSNPSVQAGREREPR